MGDIFLGVQTLVWELRPSAQTKVWTPSAQTKVWTPSPTLHHYREIFNPWANYLVLHPLGCTGAKLMATLLYEMKRRKVRYGLCTMCIGGGMGVAGVFENLMF